MDIKIHKQYKVNPCFNKKTQPIPIKSHYKNVNRICKNKTSETIINNINNTHNINYTNDNNNINNNDNNINEYSLEQGNYFPIQNSPNKFMNTLEKRLYKYYNNDINLSISN